MVKNKAIKDNSRNKLHYKFSQRWLFPSMYMYS